VHRGKSLLSPGIFPQILRLSSTTRHWNSDLFKIDNVMGYGEDARILINIVTKTISVLLQYNGNMRRIF